MKPLFCSATLLVCVLALAPSVDAQEHQHQHADTTKAMPMDHDGMMSMEQMQAMMPQMMRMHERMMADPALHERMMADPEMRQMMQEMMGPMTNGEGQDAMHQRMDAMSPDERHQMMQQMHTRMMGRMKAMSPEQHQAMMKQMTEMHRKMMADPEVRRIMEQDGDMMDHDGMDHDRMEGMRHDQIGSMDHSQMGATQRDSVEPMSAGDVRAAEAASRTADRFHIALAAGDRSAVEALLLPDAVVLEGGKTETRAEYLGHHFGGDTAFLSAVEREPLTRKTDVSGDVAWVASTSRLHGTYRDRSLDLDSAELLVLRRDASAPDGWRVAAVHWSSRSRE